MAITGNSRQLPVSAAAVAIVCCAERDDRCATHWAAALLGLIVVVPVVVVRRLVVGGGSALTGRIGRHSTAGLAVVAAATLVAAQLDQGVGHGWTTVAGRRAGGTAALPASTPAGDLAELYRETGCWRPGPAAHA